MCDLTPAALEAAFYKHAGADKKLSKCELRKMFRETMGDDCKGAKNPEEMKKMFKQLDEDGDGKLDLEEFKKAMKAIKDIRDGKAMFNDVKGQCCKK